MALSNSTQPDEQPWQPQSLRDWIEVLHGAAKFSPDHPQYGQAQQAIQDALMNIGEMGQNATDEDIKAAGQLAPGVTGNILAGIVGFGRGASLGLVKPPSVPGVGDVIGQAHPTATAVGDVAGNAALATIASPLVAGLSPAAGGAFIGGTMGATRGAIDPMLSGDRFVDSILGGALGTMFGLVGGRVLGGKAAPNAPTGIIPKAAVILRNAKTAGLKIASYFTRQGAAPDAALQATEAAVRNYFANMPESVRPSPERIEQIVAESRPLWARGAPQPALSAQARPVPPPEPKLPPGKVAPMVGTQGRGFEVTGERATPAIPASAPTIGEMSGVANLQLVPRAAAEPLATGARTASGRSVADIMREGEKVMGRPLSAAERDAVLQRLFGARTSHPGHPVWFGPGAPTE